MKAGRFIKKKVDIDIIDITLLSREEYDAAKSIIPLISNWWWLRTPYLSAVANVCYVDDVGFVRVAYVDNILGARPALKIQNLKSSNLNIGAKFSFAGHEWTVISNELALCDDLIGYTSFRKDWRAEDVNDYERSDIRNRLKNWTSESGIVVNAVKAT